MPDRIRQLVRDVPDFPKPGIMFKDITPVLRDPAGLALAIELMANPFRNVRVDAVIGPESRGFIFGTAIAQSLNAGFVPVRKPGKLPWRKRSVRYALEYGHDELQMHEDAITHGMRVLLADDLLATGGTLKAAADLVHACGGHVVGASVLIELDGLGGRAILKDLAVSSVLRY